VQHLFLVSVFNGGTHFLKEVQFLQLLGGEAATFGGVQEAHGGSISVNDNSPQGVQFNKYVLCSRTPKQLWDIK